jgi:hypothetical protein
MSLPNPGKADRFLYIFLDEAGNLDFSKNGSRFFVLGSITKERPFQAYKELTELKYNLVEQGTALEYFHASENAQAIRNQVFDIIQKNLGGVWIDAIIVEKQKVESALRTEEHFFPRVLATLLREILVQYSLAELREVIVFTDSLPVQRKRARSRKVSNLRWRPCCQPTCVIVFCTMRRSRTWTSRSRIIAPGPFTGNGRHRIPGRLTGCARPCGGNGMCWRRERDSPNENAGRENDHPGYSCERAQWALVTGVGPLNFKHTERPFPVPGRHNHALPTARSYDTQWLVHRQL